MGSVKLHLKANNLNVTHWWVDESYGTHPDLKGQTKATISIVKGYVMSASKKQKVNTTSFTISKVVGVHEASLQVLWTKVFLLNQGFEVSKSALFQDNMSAILLKNNRRTSISSRKKHIDIIYFFIQDRIEKGDIGLEYCHTNNIVADFITKPLQGNKFL